MVEEILKDTKAKMEKSLSSTQAEFNKVRTGRASLSLLDTVRVNYYGNPVPLKQVANLAIPEPRTITIQPWDRSLIGEIERAILKADIGITPNNNGVLIRLPVPTLTEERRKELVRLVHQLGEEGRVAVRNIRRDAIEKLRKVQKDRHISEDEEFKAGADVQKTTDAFIKKIDDAIQVKEKEILEV
jgi:ribosome recycling factor